GAVELLGVVEQRLTSPRADVLADAFDDADGWQWLAEDLEGEGLPAGRDDVAGGAQLRPQGGELFRGIAAAAADSPNGQGRHAKLHSPTAIKARSVSDGVHPPVADAPGSLRPAHLLKYAGALRTSSKALL